MNKMAIALQKTAGLSEDSKILDDILSLFNAASEPAKPEKLLTLKAVADEVGLHPSWLWRIGVTQACGKQVAGRKRYLKSEVFGYLESEACRCAIERVKRKRASDANKKAPHSSLLDRGVRP